MTGLTGSSALNHLANRRGRGATRDSGRWQRSRVLPAPRSDRGSPDSRRNCPIFRVQHETRHIARTQAEAWVGQTGLSLANCDEELRNLTEARLVADCRPMAMKFPTAAGGSPSRIESQATALRAGRPSYYAGLMAAADWQLTMARTRPGDKPSLAGAVSMALRGVASLLRSLSLLPLPR
jgi:hypothetical protein